MVEGSGPPCQTGAPVSEKADPTTLRDKLNSEQTKAGSTERFTGRSVGLKAFGAKLIAHSGDQFGSRGTDVVKRVV
jgi:hypothetical protein